MDKRNFAFGRLNYLLLLIGMIIVVLGFVLMAGPGSTETKFNPDIFSATRIKLAPAVCVFGFVFMIVSIMVKPKDAEQSDDDVEKEEKPIP